MKIKPVESISTPNYPDKYSDESRKAAINAIPIRWKKAPLALSLSAAMAIGLTGCQEYVTTGTPPIPVPPLGSDGVTYPTSEYIIMGDTVPIPTPVDGYIPLFEFGEGTGGFVCIAVNAPAFFSEEEAFAILASSFSEAGLTVEEKTNGINILDLPQISVEFMSLQHAQHTPDPSGLSASSFNIKSVAKARAESNPMLAVFYDPVVYGEMDYSDEDWQSAHEKAVEQAKEQSEQLLRQQAAAFIEWLQQEGLLS